ncbi:MAG: ABC transporter permease [Parachlamydiaceae bacterium]|nr:ABC transporter permease [Parachlamydiaceae bacterium]
MADHPSISPVISSLRRIKALMIKEWYQILRDWSSLLIGFILPLVLLFIYGFGVSLDLNHLKLGLILQDSSPDVQSFTQALYGSNYFDIKVAHDTRELVPSIVRGDLRGLVIIPSYFSAFSEKPDTIAPFQVIGDGSEPNTASFVQNYVNGVWQVWLQQQVINRDLKGLPLVTVDTRYWYNEELASRNFLIPGSIALIMTLIGTLLTALVVSREWERGTMEALMSTPATITEILIGKLIPYFVLGMCSMLMCTLVAVVLYKVPLRGSWLILALTSAIYLLAALGLGLLISTKARNQFVAAQAAQITAFLPAFMLSGFIFEISSMPLPIQLFTYIIPARYFVNSLQTIFLVGDVWSLLLINLVPMLTVGLILLAITSRISVKRLD